MKWPGAARPALVEYDLRRGVCVGVEVSKRSVRKYQSKTKPAFLDLGDPLAFHCLEGPHALYLGNDHAENSITGATLLQPCSPKGSPSTENIKADYQAARRQHQIA